jgi:hypothetical protein
VSSSWKWSLAKLLRLYKTIYSYPLRFFARFRITIPYQIYIVISQDLFFYHFLRVGNHKTIQKHHQNQMEQLQEFIYAPAIINAMITI